MRKAAQKDDSHQREVAEKTEQQETAEASKGVSVSISAEARRKGKLRMASDYRAEKVADVKARLEKGDLVNPESLKSGTRKMLSSLFSGEL